VLQSTILTWSGLLRNITSHILNCNEGAGQQSRCSMFSTDKKLKTTQEGRKRKLCYA